MKGHIIHFDTAKEMERRRQYMNELQVLNISGVDCYEKDGTAYLKLETVARGLGFTRDKNGTEYIMWDRVGNYLAELGFHTSAENEFPQEIAKDGFIPENIFYRLAMKAKNGTAEQFQAKVADEIIPSIRRHGGYIAGQETLSDDELLEKAVLVAKRKIAERDKIIEKQREKLEENRPKIIFADAVAASRSTILIGELAKLLRQNGINTGEKRLFEWMRQQGFLISRRGTDYNMPTQRSMEMGLFEVKERTINNPDGSVRITKTTVVTGRGQQYFINRFLQKQGAE